jgi:undecaprenyl-diphosphatase
MEEHAPLMHDEDSNREVPQHFAGGDGRVLGHGGAPVYRALDDEIVRRVNALVCESPPAQVVVAVAAERLAVVEVALMLLLALLGRRRTAVRMLLAVTAVYAACEVLGTLLPRRRPFERLETVRGLSMHAGGRSFPSRHVASGLAMAIVGGREHARLGQVMATVAWLLGATRVAAGLHYPSDVLAGAGLGWLVGVPLSPSGRRTRP